MKQTRRTFIASAAAFPFVAKPTVLGANDRIAVGIIGLGGRARWLIEHEDFGEGRIQAVADCFRPRCEQAAKLHPDGEKWAKYADYRAMFEKEKLDAVFVETTTHARVLVAIHALQAGLDVYAEKPLSLTIEEGRVLTQHVRKLGRVLQTGTQQRSIPINMFASELVRRGKIGKVKKVVVCNFLAPQKWTAKAEQPVPDGLDWNQWCNQTELRPYHRDLQYKWATWWDYDGGGQSWGVTGWGTHSLDQVQAALGMDETGPREIVVDGPAPEARVQLKYADGVVVSLEEAKRADHSQLGAIFEGSEGRLQILRGDFVTSLPELKRGAPDVTKEGPGENSYHLRNFFQCMRSRKRPNADVEIAHRSTTLCHLVNIARELGRSLKWDAKAERFVGDDEANAKVRRARRAGFELPKA
ncbi:MAG: Gfo/Idh/MocA family oxidoreductase [Bryobacteraceae bacterium]|nr:Gfo/Idh/MocA family oxidoreductase [Bryobacteraceae bacterium]